MDTKNVGILTPIAALADDMFMAVRNGQVVLLDPNTSPTLEQARALAALLTAPNIAAAVASYLAANPPAPGIQGPKGDTGPSSKVALGSITVAQNAVVAILGGVRSVVITGITGLIANEDVLVFPVSLPAGYAVHGGIATANGTLSVSVTAPALTIGQSYSISCRVVALR